MLISGVVIKMFYLGRGGGEVVQNFFSTNAHPPLLHSRLREGKKDGGGRSKQKKKIINQFGRKSDPAIILVSNK